MSASLEERTQGALMAPPRRGMTAILVTSDPTFSRRHSTVDKLERRGVYVVKTCEPGRLSVDGVRGVDMVVSIIGHLGNRVVSMQQIESVAVAADVPHYSLPAQVTAPAWQQLANDVAADGYPVDGPRSVQRASPPTPPPSAPRALPSEEDIALADLYLEDAERAKAEAADAVARLAAVQRSESDLRERITVLEATMTEAAAATTTNGSSTAAYAQQHEDDGANLRAILAGMRDIRAQLRHVDDSLSYTLGAVDALTREVASLRGTVGVHMVMANAQSQTAPPPVYAPPVVASAPAETAPAPPPPAVAPPPPMTPVMAAAKKRKPKRVVTSPGVMRDRVIAFVTAHPGTGATAVSNALQLSSGYVSRVLIDLVDRGALAYVRNVRPCTYRLPGKAPPKQPQPRQQEAQPSTALLTQSRQSRHDQIARYVAAHPGCSGPSIARALGIVPSAVYNYLGQMGSAGLLIRDTSQNPARWSAAR